MEIRAILTATLACFRPIRAKDSSAPLYLDPEDDSRHLSRYERNFTNRHGVL